MTKVALGGWILHRRWLCMLLAVMCLCTCIPVHFHDCLGNGGIVHAHHCTADCCTACTFKSLVICLLLFVGSRIAMNHIVRDRFDRHGAPPAESEETLVQLKVKLSN